MRLPSEYQEVEYIASSGTQWINTGVVPDNTTGLYIKISSQNTSSDNVYCGAATNSSDSGYKIGIGNTQNKIYFGWNNWLDSSSRPSITTNTIVELEDNFNNSRYGKKDGANIWNIGSTSLNTINYSIYVFGHNGGGTAQYFSSIKLYSFKISNGQTLVRDFVPCYRKSDNVIGLYDLVNNQFYTNSGTGTFTKGADIKGYKIKKVYIGTIEIWPGEEPGPEPQPQSGSVDFTAVSLTDLTNAGWTYTNNTPGLDSGGFYCSNTSHDKYSTLWHPIDLTEANRIYIKAIINGSSGSWAGGPSFGIFKDTSSSYPYVSGGLSFTYQNGYNGQGMDINSSGTNNTYKTNSTISGLYTLEVTVDFTTSKASYNLGGVYSTEVNIYPSDTFRQCAYIRCEAGHGIYNGVRIRSIEWDIT